MDRNTQIGLIGRPDLAMNLQKQYHQSLEEGAQLIYGGRYEVSHLIIIIIELCV